MNLLEKEFLETSISYGGVASPLGQQLSICSNKMCADDTALNTVAT